MSGRHVRKGQHVAERKHPRHARDNDYSLAIGAGVTAVVVLFLTGIAVVAALAKGVALAAGVAS